MALGRPPIGFLLIDLPSDHEIDGGLITESQVITAILHNRGLGSRVKSVRATSNAGFRKMFRPYKGLGFVHLATHGSKTGVSMIGSRIAWADVAATLNAVAPKLPSNKQRVLCLSCCYSKVGYARMRLALRGHFTGVYYFHERKIGFATAMTVWAMFYRKKTITRPAKKIVDSINGFFGEHKISYGPI